MGDSQVQGFCSGGCYCFVVVLRDVRVGALSQQMDQLRLR